MKWNLIRKRLTGLVLAATLTAGGVLPVAAETESAVQESGIEMEAELPAAEEQDAESAEPAETEPEEEITVPEEAVSESEEPEEENSVSEIQVETAEEEEAFSAVDEADEAPALKVSDKNGDETILVLETEHIKKSADKYLAAVWSADKGQDDLIWYTMNWSEQEKLYRAEVPMAKHKSVGTFYIHLYAQSADAKMTYIAKNTFEATPTVAEKIEVTDVDQNQGTAVITLSGVTSPAGITKVQFPIWCKADQSDIVWMTGKKIGDGIYQVKLDVANHSWHYGTYQIHTYATNGNGAMTFLKKTSCELKKGEISLTAEEADGSYAVKARNLEVADAAEVQFAVWSAANGQDDLKWIKAQPTTAGAASITWKPTEFGDYYIHCYVRTKAGKMVFQKALTVTVQGPSVSDIAIKTDQKTGKFTITLSGVTGTANIRKIQVPVWSDPKQADIVWYDAVKQSDGTYVVNGNISKHSYNVGSYAAHVYIQDTNGKLYYQIKDSFEMKISAGPVTVKTPENADDVYTACISGVTVPGGANNVQFAVWSAENGQDDLVWYTADNTAGDCSAVIRLQNHKSTGLYYVHVYATGKAGKKVFLGNTTFTVDLSAETTAAVTESDENAGTFNVKIHVDSAKGEIAQISAPVWVQADKKDLYEYKAVKEDDTTWLVTVDAAKHGYHIGTYNIQVKVTFAGGLSSVSSELTNEFSPKQFLEITTPEKGVRKVILSHVPSTVKKVQFPTWSKTESQDDIVWYNGTKQSDGSWTALIEAANLKHDGEVVTHCYMDGTFVGAVTSVFTKEELELRIGTQKVKKYAQAIMNANGNDLRRVYKWVVNAYTYEVQPVPVPYPNGYTRQEYYFTSAYETRKANCFGFAATFYWVAKEMGYDVTLKEARCRYRSGIYGPHSWVELRMNGTTYVCDPEAEYEKGYNCYMVTYGNAAFTYAPDMPAY